ncbi:MAG TPA: ABC transporter substrate-binding protein [Caldilineaceae bacterium]|nr:ABC transporter substrate-binding protein [Caldilineaceae bacterium]
MHKLRRRLLASTTVLLVLLLSLAACTPAAAPAPSGDTAAESAGSESEERSGEKVTLELWHHWSTSRHPLLQETVANFMAENPDIEVIETLQPQDGIVEKLLTAIAGGNAPDVAMLHRRNLPAFAAEGALMPLDSYISAEGISEDYWYPGEYASNIWDGQVYGLPLTEGLTFINYNTAMWEAAGLDPDQFPTTWDEFLAAANQLTTYSDNGQVEVAGYTIGENSGRTFLMWLLANGQASIFSDDLRTAQVNTPAAVETLTFLKRLVDETMGGYQNVQAFAAASSGLDQPPFAMETSAMETGQAWQFLVFQTANPDLQYRLAPFPGGPSGNGPVAVNQASWSYVIPQGTENPDAAWRLLKYLTVDEGAQEFLLAQDRASPVVQYNEDEAYAKTPHWDEFLAISANSRTIVVSPIQPQVEEVLNELTERVFIGDMTPEEGAEWANQEVQDLLDEFWASR